MNQYRKHIKPKHKYREFVRILNGILQFTERESAVLAQLMQLDAEWPKSQLEHKNILSTDSRKFIMKETLINKSNLTKYVNLFKKNNIILLDELGRGYINPMFYPHELNMIKKVLYKLGLAKYPTTNLERLRQLQLDYKAMVTLNAALTVKLEKATSKPTPRKRKTTKKQ